MTWTDLPAGLGGKGLDFSHYRLQRSVDNAAFADVSTQTGTFFFDRPLRAETTYYYRVVARDLAGLESVSPSVSARPFTQAPLAPFGVRFVGEGAGCAPFVAASSRGPGASATTAARHDELGAKTPEGLVNGNRGWDDRGEARQERDGLEHEMRRAVASRLAKEIRDAAVGHDRQALEREGRTGAGNLST